MVKMVDLSLPIQADVARDIHIKRLDHRRGVSVINRKIFLSRHKSLLSRLLKARHYIAANAYIKPNDLPDNEFLSNEWLSLGVHTGTHLDAPYHFGSRCRGLSARMIDMVPLEWCYGPGIKLDLSHKLRGEEITSEDVQKELDKAKLSLKPQDIVLVNTGTGKRHNSPDYYHEHPGMSEGAVRWLIKSGIKVIGIDAPGFDRPAKYMINEYLSKKDRKALWPAHFVGRQLEYCHIEGLVNLDQLPAHGFTVSCFPIKIAEAGAAWVRAVAIMDESKKE